MDWSADEVVEGGLRQEAAEWRGQAQRSSEADGGWQPMCAAVDGPSRRHCLAERSRHSGQCHGFQSLLAGGPARLRGQMEPERLRLPGCCCPRL
eukprot:2315833-Heterocapsa_arctica.AAC.1